MRQWVLLVAIVLSACSREVPDGVTELVYASPYPPSHPFSQADQEWMDFVDQQSDGTLNIRPSWSGALLSSEHSMLELRHGIADIGLITPIYVKGGTHLIRIQSGFYEGTTSIEQQVELYRCLSENDPQFADEMQGLVVLAVQGGSLPGIITTGKPVSSLEDLRGMRLRVPAELVPVMRDLGVDPVTMPMGDVYPALARGMLDGVAAPVDTFRSLHFADVASYYSTLEIPRGAYPARAIRESRWQALTPAHRRVLEEAIPVWEAALARQIYSALDEGRDHALAEGIEFNDFSEAEQRRFSTLYVEHAAASASELDAYGIDGNAVFELARASVGTDGSVSCKRGNN